MSDSPDDLYEQVSDKLCRNHDHTPADIHISEEESELNSRANAEKWVGAHIIPVSNRNGLNCCALG